MYKIYKPRERFNLINVSDIKRNEIVCWCQEMFGKPMPVGNAKWDHYVNSGVSSEGNLTMIDYFIFYDDLAAIAFKLQWL